MEKQESRELEYKSQKTNSYLKTVSAFANYGGGKIIFGINDNGDVVGIKGSLKNFCLDVENTVNDAIEPKVGFSLKIDDKQKTVSLEIFEGNFKPYLYKGKAYKRNDTSTVEVDRLELKRLILEGQNQNFESLVSEKQDLKFSVLEKELSKTLRIKKMSNDILKTLGLCTSENKFNIAALLISDKNSAPGLDIVQFGSSISEIKNRVSIKNVSVIKQYLSGIEEFSRYYKTEKIEGSVRKVIELIPETSFREALANALCHRLWDINADIKISFFEDRIEISSPGGLPSGISKEEYLNGQISILRNPILAGVLFRLNFMEKFGTGILRIRADYRQSATKPDFRIFENSICVVLPVMMAEPENLSSDESKVYKLILHRRLSREQIENALGWKKDKTIRILARLEQKGFAEKLGVGKAVEYEARK